VSEDADTDLIAELRRRIATLEDELERERRQSSYWFRAWRMLALARVR
jgi:hypothetical protein